MKIVFKLVKNINSALTIFLMLLLTACVSTPEIDSNKFSKPKTIAIIDIPPLKVTAQVEGIIGVKDGRMHFTEHSFYYFDIDEKQRQEIFDKHKVTAYADGWLTALILTAVSEDTKEKSHDFEQIFIEANPNLDFKNDFIEGLATSLEERNILTTIIKDEVITAPYLRWPAASSEGLKYYSGELDDFPAIEADILLQVSPVVMFWAPGVLNSYTRSASVGVAAYDGQTKQFLGYQVFAFRDGVFSRYGTLDSLKEGAHEAGPWLHKALMNVVPMIVDKIVSEGNKE